MSAYTDNPYQQLGVDADADVATIKKAYRKLALQYHPDRAGGDTVKFAQIANAYEILTDSYLRAEYDRSVASSAAAVTTTTPSGTAAGTHKEWNNASSSNNTKKSKLKHQKNHQKSTSDEAPPVFRYHFSDPYEVWKRDFKDQFGIDYPGAQYDWVSHDDREANDHIDRYNKANNNTNNNNAKQLQNGTTPDRATNNNVMETSATPKSPEKSPKRGGFASLFRRKNKPTKEDTPPLPPSSDTALVPFSQQLASPSSSALVPRGTTTELAKRQNVATSAVDNNSHQTALVATTGRNNRPISMDVKTMKDGKVTTTTTTLVRPDGSTETITMRTGLPGPPPDHKKKLALTSGGDYTSANTPSLTNGDKTATVTQQALTNGNEKNLLKALPNETKQMKQKKEKMVDQKTITDGTNDTKKKDKKPKKPKRIENGSQQALVAID